MERMDLATRTSASTSTSAGLGLLVPSQAVAKSNKNRANNETNASTLTVTQQNRARRRKPQKKKANSDATSAASNSNKKNNNNTTSATSQATSTNVNNGKNKKVTADPCSSSSKPNVKSRKKRKNGTNKRSAQPSKGEKAEGDVGTTINNAEGKGTLETEASDNTNQRKKPPLSAPKLKKKKKQKPAKFPWRTYIPKGAVDPITLDPLASLAYPPFCLCASAPYTVILEWPIVSNTNTTTIMAGEKEDGTKKQTFPSYTKGDQEELLQQRLKEQWGDQLELNTASTRGNREASNDVETTASSTITDTPTNIDEDAKQSQPTRTLTNNDDTQGSHSPDTMQIQPKKRHYNLYDGRALAYYLVSQLQFIDPMNRRNLTRDELLNLDRYLQRHKLVAATTTRSKHNKKHKHVSQNVLTDAYDAKGVTISIASATGQTPEGRVQMLQEEARVLLNAMFATGNTTTYVSPPPPQDNGNADTANRFQQQYVSHQERSRTTTNNNPTNHRTQPTAFNALEEQEVGIYYQPNDNEYNSTHNRHGNRSTHQNHGGNDGGNGGMIVIDDDINPGLRGGGFRSVAGITGSSSNNNSNNHALWSASNNTTRYNHAIANHESNFPSLAGTPATTSPTADASAAFNTSNSAPPVPVTAIPRSLQRIGKVVKKTTPEEIKRQRQAREEAQRKAALSQLSFIVPSTASIANNTPNGFLGVPNIATLTDTTTAMPSQGQLERNRAFALALGVAPSASSRIPTYGQSNTSNYKSGWARPCHTGTTTTTTSRSSISTAQWEDDFEKELVYTTCYPDVLLAYVRDGGDKESNQSSSTKLFSVLTKLERQWKTFLQDDTSASLPLRAMDRGLRKLVHEYAVFWKLQTESFDPEPKRYVHCVKLLDTSAPFPLLSDVARSYRGPNMEGALLLQQQQQQQQGPLREFPSPPDRVPLQLKARSSLDAIEQQQQQEESMNHTAMQNHMHLMSISEDPANNAIAYSDEDDTNGRFDSLFVGRERPKIELAPRTIPAELPAFEPNGNGDNINSKSYDPLEERARRVEEVNKKELKEREERKQKARILEAAFASSDEESDGNDASSSSEWEEEEALYSGSEDTNEE